MKVMAFGQGTKSSIPNSSYSRSGFHCLFKGWSASDNSSFVKPSLGIVSKVAIVSSSTVFKTSLLHKDWADGYAFADAIAGWEKGANFGRNIFFRIPRKLMILALLKAGKEEICVYV